MKGSKVISVGLKMVSNQFGRGVVAQLMNLIHSIVPSEIMCHPTPHIKECRDDSAHLSTQIYLALST